MASLRSAAALLCLTAVLAGVLTLAQPDPPTARANVACDTATAPLGTAAGAANAITGGLIPGGNPAGDLCNKATDPLVGAVASPIEGALKGIGNSIFVQLTGWVSDGATWLIGQVSRLITETTTPDLTGKAFLGKYGQMAALASFFALIAVLLAVLEGLARGDTPMLWRVLFVHLPLAFIATSAAYVIVQLLLTATDGMSHAIAQSTGKSTHQFFAGAAKGLANTGGSAGGAAGTVTGGALGAPVGKAEGSVGAPLFVAFLAAIIAAFGAFFVWIELLIRDAAVYVVALFLPMSLAASIWPRWTGVLRRTAELLLVVIASKFVIVSIIALAAGLLANGSDGVEHILAAAALMMLACFAPFVLFKLVPFAEGAVASAYGRRSAGGGTVQTVSSVQMMQRSLRGGAEPALAGGGTSGTYVRGVSASTGEGGRLAVAGASDGAAAPGAGGVGPEAAGALPMAAAEGAQSAATTLAASGTAQAASEAASPASTPTEQGKLASSREIGDAEQGLGGAAPTPGEAPARPTREPGMPGS